MSSTKIILITVAVAVAIFAALALFVLSPARSVGDRLMQRNQVDHIEYTDTVSQHNIVHGTPGDDVIHGNKVGPGKPSQIIYGAGGEDRIWGGKGSDEVHGGPGNDRLHGYHAGADELYGEGGKDICIIGQTPGGHTNDETFGCKVKFKPAQGHG